MCNFCPALSGVGTQVLVVRLSLPYVAWSLMALYPLAEPPFLSAFPCLQSGAGLDRWLEGGIAA